MRTQLNAEESVDVLHILALLQQRDCKHPAAEFELNRLSTIGSLLVKQHRITFCRRCGLTLEKKLITR